MKSVDLNIFDNVQKKAQSPSLYQQMNKHIYPMLHELSENELLRGLERIRNATVNNDGIYDASGSLIYSMKGQRDSLIKLNSTDPISDEMLQEILTGIGIDNNGEIRRHEGYKSQMKGIIETLIKK